ncbi:hypothetical protein TWF696_002196 [Orbilia brochopaga]|uniref:Uncharacterized protein n=1 Tax=Orbilia brochopaga TaxID=3140254 RepID=A0AAV9U611_9PEZI
MAETPDGHSREVMVPGIINPIRVWRYHIPSTLSEGPPYGSNARWNLATLYSVPEIKMLITMLAEYETSLLGVRIATIEYAFVRLGLPTGAIRHSVPFLNVYLTTPDGHDDERTEFEDEDAPHTPDLGINPIVSSALDGRPTAESQPRFQWQKIQYPVVIEGAPLAGCKFHFVVSVPYSSVHFTRFWCAQTLDYERASQSNELLGKAFKNVWLSTGGRAPLKNIGFQSAGVSPQCIELLDKLVQNPQAVKEPSAEDPHRYLSVQYGIADPQFDDIRMEFLSKTPEGQAVLHFLNQENEMPEPVIDRLFFQATDDKGGLSERIVAVYMQVYPAEYLRPGVDPFNVPVAMAPRPGAEWAGQLPNINPAQDGQFWDPGMDAELQGAPYTQGGNVDVEVLPEPASPGRPSADDRIDTRVYAGAYQKSASNSLSLLNSPDQISKSFREQWSLQRPGTLGSSSYEQLVQLERKFNYIVSQRRGVWPQFSELYNSIEDDVIRTQSLNDLATVTHMSRHTVTSKNEADAHVFIDAFWARTNRALHYGIWKLPEAVTPYDLDKLRDQLFASWIKIGATYKKRANEGLQEILPSFLALTTETQILLQRLYSTLEGSDMITSKKDEGSEQEDVHTLWLQDPMQPDDANHLTPLYEQHGGPQTSRAPEQGQQTLQNPEDHWEGFQISEDHSEAFTRLRLWFLLLGTPELTILSSIYPRYGYDMKIDEPMREISGIGVRWTQSQSKWTYEILARITPARAGVIDRISEQNQVWQTALAFGRGTRPAYDRGQCTILYQLVCGQAHPAVDAELLSDHLYRTQVDDPMTMRTMLPPGFEDGLGDNEDKSKLRYHQWQYRKVRINQVNINEGPHSPYQFMLSQENGHFVVSSLPGFLPHPYLLARIYYKAIFTAVLAAGRQSVKLRWLVIAQPATTVYSKRIIKEVYKGFVTNQAGRMEMTPLPGFHPVIWLTRIVEAAATHSPPADEFPFFPMYPILGIPEVEAFVIMLRQYRIGIGSRIGKVSMACNIETEGCNIWLQLKASTKVDAEEYPTL